MATQVQLFVSYLNGIIERFPFTDASEQIERINKHPLFQGCQHFPEVERRLNIIKAFKIYQDSLLGNDSESMVEMHLHALIDLLDHHEYQELRINVQSTDKAIVQKFIKVSRKKQNGPK